MNCFCDYEPASIYNQRVSTARKPYQCFECRAAIQPGERYERVFGVWDGYSYTHLTCARCYNIRTWLKNNLPCFCWAHGNLDEDARNAVEEAVSSAPQETAGLRFGFGRLLVARARHNRRSHQEGRGR